MSEEKRALSWKQFVESDFDGRDYAFADFEGTFSATIACKRWDKHQNILVYLDFDDGQKILASAWQNANYLGLGEMPVGTRVEVVFKNSTKGIPYLRAVERL